MNSSTPEPARNLPSPSISPRALFWILLAGAATLRLVILLVYSSRTTVSWENLLDGHDGAEYLGYARALAAGDLAGVPHPARRLEAGLPLLLSPFTLLPFPAFWTYLVSTGCAFLAAGILFRLLSQNGRAGASQAALLGGAMLLVYPTQVYFSCFIMTESLFLALTLGSVWFFDRGRSRTAYLMAGLSALVRGPGLLLAPAFAIADLLARRGAAPAWRRALWAPLTLVPPLIWMGITSVSWRATTLSVHRPSFGLPFSGFAGISEVSPVRAAYIIVVVTLVSLATLLLVREAAARRWREPWQNAAAVFALTYFLFHLSLQSLQYYGRTIATFNYQDRYYVALLPYVLYAFRSSLRPLVVVLLTLLSLGLSLHWGLNYFAARQRSAPPLTGSLTKPVFMPHCVKVAEYNAGGGRKA